MFKNYLNKNGNYKQKLNVYGYGRFQTILFHPDTYT